MYPVYVQLDGKLAVVVGGGPVGQRKAAGLIASGARVRLICRENASSDRPERLEWIVADYRADHLAGAALVFAAGPRELNQTVVADARVLGIWVSSATDPADGDFITPASVRRGPLLLAIGTSGAAPRLTRTLRQQLERQFDAAYGQWVSLLAELRPLVLHEIGEPSERERLFAEWTDLAWLDRLRRDGSAATRAAMIKQLERARGQLP